MLLPPFRLTSRRRLETVSNGPQTKFGRRQTMFGRRRTKFRSPVPWSDWRSTKFKKWSTKFVRPLTKSVALSTKFVCQETKVVLLQFLVRELSLKVWNLGNCVRTVSTCCIHRKVWFDHYSFLSNSFVKMSNQQHNYITWKLMTHPLLE